MHENSLHVKRSNVFCNGGLPLKFLTAVRWYLQVRFNIPQLNTNKQLYEKFIITASIHLVYNTEHHHFFHDCFKSVYRYKCYYAHIEEVRLKIAATCSLRKWAIGYASLLRDTITECRHADRKSCLWRLLLTKTNRHEFWNPCKYRQADVSWLISIF